jgi:hypothetical protein
MLRLDLGGLFFIANKRSGNENGSKCWFFYVDTSSCPERRGSEQAGAHVCEHGSEHAIKSYF